MTCAEDLIAARPPIATHCIVVDPTRVMFIVHYPETVIVQCTHTDEEGITTVETLESVNWTIFKIIGRYRSGINHNEMRWYERDDKYPIGSKVRL